MGCRAYKLRIVEGPSKCHTRVHYGKNLRKQGRHVQDYFILMSVCIIYTHLSLSPCTHGNIIPYIHR